jgi:hypothetical protein
LRQMELIMWAKLADMLPATEPLNTRRIVHRKRLDRRRIKVEKRGDVVLYSAFTISENPIKCSPAMCAIFPFLNET